MWLQHTSAYIYNIEYRKATENANADAMSRLPAGVTESDVDNEIFMCSFPEDIPTRAKDIREATKVDPVLSQVFKYNLEDDGINQKLREFKEHDPIHLKNSMEELKNGNRVVCSPTSNMLA